jgi:hypothetical protein
MNAVMVFTPVRFLDTSIFLIEVPIGTLCTSNHSLERCREPSNGVSGAFARAELDLLKSWGCTSEKWKTEQPGSLPQAFVHAHFVQFGSGGDDDPRVRSVRS